MSVLTVTLVLEQYSWVDSDCKLNLLSGIITDSTITNTGKHPGSSHGVQ